MSLTEVSPRCLYHVVERPYSFSPVTPRRWLDQCNPLLSNLITETLGIKKEVWLKDLFKLEGLLKHVDDPTFQKKWAVVKQSNKERLAHYVEVTLGVRCSLLLPASFDSYWPFFLRCKSTRKRCSTFR